MPTDTTDTPTPEQAALRAAEAYERTFVPPIGRPAARLVVDAAAIEPGERVLDLACGTGVAARLAAERTGPSGSVVGVDPIPAMLEVAGRVAPELDWRSGAAEDLPLADGAVDVVVCSQGFQFFDDRSRALDEIARVLTPGGRVVLGTPGPTPAPMAVLEAALADHLGPEAAGFVDAVFSVHDPAEVTDLLTDAGFVDVAADPNPLTVRVPPPAEFLWQYVFSTPLGMQAAGLDDDTRAALERDVVIGCEPHVEGDALVIEPGLLVARGRRSRGEETS